jgi:hypothetical protein
LELNQSHFPLRHVSSTVQGAFALKAWNGIFENVVALEFWAYVGEVQSGGFGANIPDIQVSISGKKVRWVKSKKLFFLLLLCSVLEFVMAQFFGSS